MKKTVKITSIVFLICIMTVSGIITPGPTVSGCVEQPQTAAYAEWRESKGQSYLYIFANTYQELGFLEGFHLASQILALQAITEGLAYQMGLPYEYFVGMALQYEPFIPEQYRLEIQAISEGVNAYLEDIGAPTDYSYAKSLTGNVFFDIFYGVLLPLSAGEHVVYPPLGCTTIGALNRFLFWTNPTIAQNVDLGPGMEHVLAWVLTEMPGKPRIFTLRGGPVICTSIGKSDHVSVCSNFLFSTVYGFPNIPYGVRSRMLFESSTTAREAIEFLPQTFSMHYTLSDNTELYTVEVSPIHLSVHEVDNIVVRANMFVDEMQYDMDPNDSVMRIARALKLLEEYWKDYKVIQFIRNKNILRILGDPGIARYSPQDMYPTAAFFLAYPGGGQFGMGTTNNSPHGKVPI
ncbi:MAG: hypothetical protein ACFFCZ_19335 [Promethearchaeota archaeon]